MPRSAATNSEEAQTATDREAGSRTRLVAQRGLFGGPQPVCPADLYARVTRGDAVRERHRLIARPHSEVTGDTYFGRFPASYWQRWTVVDEVTLELVVTGSGQLSVVGSDSHGETRAVAARDIVDADRTTITFPLRLASFVDGGYLWLDVSTAAAELTVEELRWTVAAPDRVRPTSVVICTFNRADDCTNTLASLAADPEVLDRVAAVYVVDQGTDTVASRPAFPDLEKAFDGRLRYLRQPNLGGAGGFGRGLYEVTENGQGGDVLLMDDDVLCEPEIVVRLGAFANRTVAPTIVGGQMLKLLHPTYLLAGAEEADFANLVPGKVVPGALADVDLLGEELDEETELPTGRPNRGDRRVDAHYNAWWSCLIPTELVSRLGYPLPLFFQWDDVDYGYRARAAGFSTVTLPGAGLWHADFDRKDADKWNEYFAVRNAMIVTSLHAEIDPVQMARVLVSRIVRSLLSMQYGLAATVIKAGEDFLRGPAVFADGGAAAAAEIRRVRAEYPDTVIHPASDVPGVRPGDLQLVAAGKAPSLNRVILLRRLFDVALGRTAHQLGQVPHADAAWWHVSQFETAVVTDASQEGVRIRRRDRRLTMELARRTARMVRRLLAEAPRLRQEYRAAVPEVTSKENWKRLYDL
ncbi:MAG TPA: glycosyltransferase [Pseudonocardiaceae bacterium]